jgi:hypothetical protein
MLFGHNLWAIGDSSHSKMSIDSILNKSDSFINVSHQFPQNLKDSLAQPELLRNFFFINETISGRAKNQNQVEKARDLPRLKAIKLRKQTTDHWKFWVLLFSVFFLALVRLLNIKRFDEILVSAFDLQTDYKDYSAKTSNYLWSNIGLFINFVISLSLFLTSLFEFNHQLETENYFLLFWKLSGILVLVYLGKIVINLILGSIFKMWKLSRITLFNAIMINNILGIGLVILNLFFVFVSNVISANIIGSIILITILVAVIYRQIKNLMMTPQSGRFQFLYIFLYLCALELLPWMVLFKMFLNSW